MPMLYSLLASCDKLPDTWYEPLLVPILFSMVGGGIYLAGKTTEMRELKPKPWKWGSMLPLAVALYSGLMSVTCVGDSFYRSAMMQFAAKKYMTSHIGGLVVPVIAIAVIAIWEWRSSRDPFRQ